MLYLADVSFEKLGLPVLGDEGVAAQARNIQHGVYKGFIAPVALYGILGAVIWRNRRAAQKGGSDDKHRAKPVGGPVVFNRFTKFLVIFLGLWVLILAYRFAAGIGAVSGLTDGYPWGVWIAFDVVTGTALGCGGYAIAILAYILNKGKYHPLVRPALLTSALGYSMAALAIIIDVGRSWFIWRIPLGGFPDVGKYNWNSALLEVALCVMAYVGVLWIELGPAFLEKWEATSKNSALVGFAKAGLKFFDKALIWIIALGVLLPTMHQSSLGTVMLLAGPKLHRLWNTGWIPLLFLISCIGMGYAVVVWESAVSSTVFKRQRETAC